jgi:transposase
MEEEHIETERYIQFLKQLIRKRQRPLILLTDRAPFHTSKKLRDFVRAHRSQLRVYFLPRRAPELNPDEQVWNEVIVTRLSEHNIIGKITKS